MFPKTLVTGANGRIGRVLRERLTAPAISFTSRADLDVANSVALVAALAGYEQIVHLATPIKGLQVTKAVMDASVDMVDGVLQAALRAGVRRAVIPSSFGAAAAQPHRGGPRVTIAESQPAATEFGRTRLQIESRCREAARSGMDVVCIRLGTVLHPDAPSRHAGLGAHWLSHEDVASLFSACCAAPVVPGRFSLFYAVSDVPERIFDTANPFGWTPQTKRMGTARTLIAMIHRVNTGIRGRLQIQTRFKAALGRWRRH